MGRVSRRLCIVRPDGEAELRADAATNGWREEAAGWKPPLRPRSAVDSAMRKGLFGTAFGPGFYRGYMSEQKELVPVALAPDAEVSSRDAAQPDAGPGGEPGEAGLPDAGDGTPAFDFVEHHCDLSQPFGTPAPVSMGALNGKFTATGSRSRRTSEPSTFLRSGPPWCLISERG